MMWKRGKPGQVNEGAVASNDGGPASNRRWWSVFSIVLILLIGATFLIINSRSPGLPRADQNKGTAFQGMSSFINNGLTSDQVNEIIKAFNKFSANAKDVSVDTNSLSPGPHTPGTLDPFTIRFRATVDSSRLTGTVSYTDLSSIRLVLFDTAGKQVFDSGLITSP